MVDRQEQLDELLAKLKKADTRNESDIDLVLTYLERYLAAPQTGGGSKKLLEFEIDNDIATNSRRYRIHWIAETDLDLRN